MRIMQQCSDIDDLLIHAIMDELHVLVLTRPTTPSLSLLSWSKLSQKFLDVILSLVIILEAEKPRVNAKAIGILTYVVNQGIVRGCWRALIEAVLGHEWI